MTKFQMIKAILNEYQKNCATPQEAKDLCRLYYKLLKLQEVNVKESALAETLT